MPSYDQSLQWLQGLLSGPNWKYSLSREQLGTEAALRREALAEQSRQAAAELALQRVIADWQNQLARQQQQQAAQQQAYTQQTQTYQTSPQFLNILRTMQPSQFQASLDGNFMQDFYRRMNYNPTAAAAQSNYLWDIGMPGYSLGTTAISSMSPEEKASRARALSELGKLGMTA